jgi:hypothetical protein
VGASSSCRCCCGRLGFRNTLVSLSLYGQHQFHFRDIPDKWFKVDVREAHFPNAALMFPDDNAEQLVIRDVLNGNTVWDGKHMKTVK